MVNDYGASHDFSKGRRNGAAPNFGKATLEYVERKPIEGIDDTAHKTRKVKSEGKNEKRIWTRLDKSRTMKFEAMRDGFKSEAFGVGLYEKVWDNDSEVLRRIIDLGYAYYLFLEEQKKTKEKTRNQETALKIL
jgi:hypothetical protein